MPAKTRVIIVCSLILLGGALFSYCAFFYPIEIATPAQGSFITAIGSEQASSEKISTGNSKQDNQTGSKGKSGRKAGFI
jgi:hypothetical protein